MSKMTKSRQRLYPSNPVPPSSINASENSDKKSKDIRKIPSLTEFFSFPCQNKQSQHPSSQYELKSESSHLSKSKPIEIRRTTTPMNKNPIDLSPKKEVNKVITPILRRPIDHSPLPQKKSHNRIDSSALLLQLVNKNRQSSTSSFVPQDESKKSYGLKMKPSTSKSPIRPLKGQILSSIGIEKKNLDEFLDSASLAIDSLHKTIYSGTLSKEQRINLQMTLTHLELLRSELRPKNQKRSYLENFDNLKSQMINLSKEMRSLQLSISEFSPLTDQLKKLKIKLHLLKEKERKIKETIGHKTKWDSCQLSFSPLTTYIPLIERQLAGVLEQRMSRTHNRRQSLAFEEGIIDDQKSHFSLESLRNISHKPIERNSLPTQLPQTSDKAKKRVHFVQDKQSLTSTDNTIQLLQIMNEAVESPGPKSFELLTSHLQNAFEHAPLEQQKTIFSLTESLCKGIEQLRRSGENSKRLEDKLNDASIKVQKLELELLVKQEGRSSIRSNPGSKPLPIHKID